jgi:hypothetical protein
MLLAALFVSSSGVTPDSLNLLPHEDQNAIKTQATARNSDVREKTGKGNEMRVLDEDMVVTRPLCILPTLAPTAEVSTLAKPKNFRDVQDRELPKPKGFGGILSLGDRLSSSISSSVSADVSSSVSSSISSIVSSSDASVLAASLLALTSASSIAVQSARDAGFQDGKIQAKESAQSAIDAARASALPSAVSHIHPCKRIIHS